MQITAAIERIYAKTSLRIGLHIFFWMLMFVVRAYLTYVSFNVYRAFSAQAYLLLNLNSTVLMAAFYYIMVYALIPYSLHKRKYLIGVIFILILLILYTTADTAAESLIIKECEQCVLSLRKYNTSYGAYLNRGLINVVLTRLLSLGSPILLLFSLCIPFSIKMGIQFFREKLHSLQLEKDNLQLEFNFLKAQVNPHFLFNSMNNIYGLIISGNKEKSAALVARLSELLRYTLYDANERNMPLLKEIKLLQDYLELEKVRLNETKVKFDWNLDRNDYTIAPLLLMPLIENAFKYCGDSPDSFVHIYLAISKGELHVRMDNSIDSGRVSSSNGGIGLANFEKRMDMYYKNRYSYVSDISTNRYAVILTLQLI